MWCAVIERRGKKHRSIIQQTSVALWCSHVHITKAPFRIVNAREHQFIRQTMKHCALRSSRSFVTCTNMRTPYFFSEFATRHPRLPAPLPSSLFRLETHRNAARPGTKKSRQRTTRARAKSRPATWWSRTGTTRPSTSCARSESGGRSWTSSSTSRRCCTTLVPPPRRRHPSRPPRSPTTSKTSEVSSRSTGQSAPLNLLSERELETLTFHVNRSAMYSLATKYPSC